MPFKPTFEGERPTLGYHVLEWIEANLGAPDRFYFEPFVPTREQCEFVLRLYELDPATGKRIIRRAVLSRPRGWGKSPFVSALAIAEGLADVVFDGWDADGQPVGKPWALVRRPLVQIAAASEEQTKNSWAPLLEMLREDAPVFDNYPGLEPMGGFVNMPYGRIEKITTSATSAKGNVPILVLCDQTEQWTPTNKGPEVFGIIRNNVTKTGGLLVETPNAYTPGSGSVAEATAQTFRDIAEGRNKRLHQGVLYDHREAPADTDLSDEDSLTAGLRYAYGCSSDHPAGCVIHDPPCKPGWSPIEGTKQRIWETDADEQASRSDFLNQITNASDSWLASYEISGAAKADVVVRDGEAITLGFDGSRGKSRGKPDATALIGCTVEGGHLFEIGVWEADNNPNSWDDWQPPIHEIEAALRTTFAKYRVVGFYADPAKDWRSHVNSWEATWGRNVKVKARRDHPFEWWMTGGRATQGQIAIESLEGAIRNGDASHAGTYDLVRHLTNARRRLSNGKLALGKQNDYSPHKIDAAVASVLAWQARLDAVAAGIRNTAKSTATIIRAR